MLLATLWSLRQREVRAANSDSKNWTEVVTMTGASQFSQARRVAAFFVFDVIRVGVAVMLDHGIGTEGICGRHRPFVR